MHTRKRGQIGNNEENMKNRTLVKWRGGGWFSKKRSKGTESVLKSVTCYNTKKKPQQKTTTKQSKCCYLPLAWP